MKKALPNKHPPSQQPTHPISSISHHTASAAKRNNFVTSEEIQIMLQLRKFTSQTQILYSIQQHVQYLFIELSKHADTVVFLGVVMETHHAISLVHRRKDLIIFNLPSKHQQCSEQH